MKLDTAKVRELCDARFGSKPGDEQATHGQSVLADCAGISPTTLSRLLNGHNQPQRGTLAALAGALGVEVADLLEETEAQRVTRLALAQGVDLEDDGYTQSGDDW